MTFRRSLANVRVVGSVGLFLPPLPSLAPAPAPAPAPMRESDWTDPTNRPHQFFRPRPPRARDFPVQVLCVVAFNLGAFNLGLERHAEENTRPFSDDDQSGEPELRSHARGHQALPRAPMFRGHPRRPPGFSPYSPKADMQLLRKVGLGRFLRLANY
jgi:hypothetical protein